MSSPLAQLQRPRKNRKASLLKSFWQRLCRIELRVCYRPILLTNRLVNYEWRRSSLGAIAVIYWLVHAGSSRFVLIFKLADRLDSG